MVNQNSPTAILLTPSTTSSVGAAMVTNGVAAAAGQGNIGTRVLVFDSTVEEYSPTTSWTHHPVENGVNITDHAQVKPLDFTLKGMVTETPFAGSIPVVFSPTIAASGAQRILDAYRFLQACEGQIVVVQTARWGALDNCGITSYRHTVDIAGRVIFQVGVTQIRIASSGTAVLPPLKTVVPGASTAGNVGSQALQAATDSQAQSTAKFGADTVGTSDAFARLWAAL